MPSKLAVDEKSLIVAFRNLWDDATNAVCQTMQDRGMCNCNDGDCVAAKVWPSPIDLTNAKQTAETPDGRLALAEEGRE